MLSTEQVLPGDNRTVPVDYHELKRLLPTENALPILHDARHLRTTEFHCPAGETGTNTVSQPRPFPRGIRAET